MIESKLVVMAVLGLALRACKVRWDDPAFWVSIFCAATMGALP